jgi:thiamine biosynthesis lipoprotein ApbE
MMSGIKQNQIKGNNRAFVPQQIANQPIIRRKDAAKGLDLDYFRTMNRWVVSLVLLTVFAALLFACKKKKTTPFVGRFYSGLFFGVPYSVDVVGDSTDYQQAIDSILGNFERAFDLQRENSTLTRYNRFARTDSAFVFYDTTHVFGIVYDLAKELNRRTNQYYDPTTNPIKREWFRVKVAGKGEEPNLDSLYNFVMFDGAKLDLNEVEGDNHVYLRSQLRKADRRIEADFTGIASAYGLDQVSEYLKSKNVKQFRISRGAQLICYGNAVDSLNLQLLGISGTNQDPKIRLVNRSFCFKNFQDKAGMVDVTYGYPVDNELVYVGVSARTLVESEVFSEAFMIMGYENAGSWYQDETNQNSDVQSLMMFKAGDEIRSASTEGFDIMFVTPDSLQQETP